MPSHESELVTPKHYPLQTTDSPKQDSCDVTDLKVEGTQKLNKREKNRDTASKDLEYNNKTNIQNQGKPAKSSKKSNKQKKRREIIGDQESEDSDYVPKQIIESPSNQIKNGPNVFTQIETSLESSRVDARRNSGSRLEKPITNEEFLIKEEVTPSIECLSTIRHPGGSETQENPKMSENAAEQTCMSEVSDFTDLNKEFIGTEELEKVSVSSEPRMNDCGIKQEDSSVVKLHTKCQTHQSDSFKHSTDPILTREQEVEPLISYPKTATLSPPRKDTSDSNSTTHPSQQMNLCKVKNMILPSAPQIAINQQVQEKKGKNKFYDLWSGHSLTKDKHEQFTSRVISDRFNDGFRSYMSLKNEIAKMRREKNDYFFNILTWEEPERFSLKARSGRRPSISTQNKIVPVENFESDQIPHFEQATPAKMNYSISTFAMEHELASTPESALLSESCANEGSKHNLYECTKSCANTY